MRETPSQNTKVIVQIARLRYAPIRKKLGVQTPSAAIGLESDWNNRASSDTASFSWVRQEAVPYYFINSVCPLWISYLFAGF